MTRATFALWLSYLHRLFMVVCVTGAVVIARNAHTFISTLNVYHCFGRMCQHTQKLSPVSVQPTGTSVERNHGGTKVLIPPNTKLSDTTPPSLVFCISCTHSTMSSSCTRTEHIVIVISIIYPGIANFSLACQHLTVSFVTYIHLTYQPSPLHYPSSYRQLLYFVFTLDIIVFHVHPPNISPYSFPLSIQVLPTSLCRASSSPCCRHCACIAQCPV